jgi:hypothetical protein
VATESDLRDLLQGPDPEGRVAIDLDAVLRRARARRRPRAIAATAVGALALVGVMTPVVLISQQATTQQSVLTAEDAGGAGEAPTADNAFMTLTAASLNTCGASVVELPSPNGLVLEVTPVTAPAETADILADVTLRNDGPLTLVGTTATTPVIAFSRDGIVLWHTSGSQDASGVRVDLDPGESMTYLTTFKPLICTPEDEAEASGSDSDGLREGLPAAGPGTYQLSAAIDFIPDDGSSGSVLVTGPSSAAHLE